MKLHLIIFLIFITTFDKLLLGASPCTDDRKTIFFHHVQQGAKRKLPKSLENIGRYDPLHTNPLLASTSPISLKPVVVHRQPMSSPSPALKSSSELSSGSLMSTTSLWSLLGSPSSAQSPLSPELASPIHASPRCNPCSVRILEEKARDLQASRGSQGFIKSIDLALAECLTPKLWVMITEYLLPGSQIPDAQSISDIDFSPTQDLMIIARNDGQVRLWESSQDSCRLLKIWGAHFGCADIAAFSHDGNVLVTTGKDRALNVIDMEDFHHVGSCITTGDPQLIHSALAHATRDETTRAKIAKARHLAYRKWFRTAKSNATRTRFIAFNKDATQLFLRDNLDNIAIFSLRDLSKIHTMAARKGTPIELDAHWPENYAHLKNAHYDPKDLKEEGKEPKKSEETHFDWHHASYLQKRAPTLWIERGKVAYIKPDQPDQLHILHGWLDPSNPGHQIL